VLVEDDIATLRALSQQVSALDGFELVCATMRFDEAMTALHRPVDLLLVDLDLGAHSGIDIIRACRQRHAEARILVISVLGDEKTVITALEAGADGYLLKDTSQGRFGEELNALMRGEAPISPGIARHLLKRFRQGGPSLRVADAGLDMLSPRELQMLEALAQGLSYKDVARRLDLSIHTVGDYVKGLYRKLQVNSRGEAVSRALRERLIAVDDSAY
jgi:DNA-binding NarL/FixJ family response regulator